MHLQTERRRLIEKVRRHREAGHWLANFRTDQEPPDTVLRSTMASCIHELERDLVSVCTDELRELEDV